MMYYVIQPCMPRHQPDWAESSTIISRHRTEAAAERAISAATSRLCRQPGMAQSWLDWHVVPASALSRAKRGNSSEQATFAPARIRSSRS